MKIFSAAGLITVIGIIYLLNNVSSEQIKSINTLAGVRGMPDLRINYIDDIDIDIKLAQHKRQLKTVLALKQSGLKANSLRKLNEFESLPSHRVVDIVDQNLPFHPIACILLNWRRFEEVIAAIHP